MLIRSFGQRLRPTNQILRIWPDPGPVRRYIWKMYSRDGCTILAVSAVNYGRHDHAIRAARQAYLQLQQRFLEIDQSICNPAFTPYNPKGL